MSINFSGVKSITIPEGVVSRILSGTTVLWQKLASFKNWILYNTEADGSPYNGGLGYKVGYRIRSGGAEDGAAQNICTGFIPCKAGDTIRVYSPASNAFISSGGINALNFYNASKTNLGQITSNGRYGIFENANEWANVSINGGLLTYTVSTSVSGVTNIAFVRVTLGFSGTPSGDGLIITINEEIALWKNVA